VTQNHPDVSVVAQLDDSQQQAPQHAITLTHDRSNTVLPHSMQPAACVCVDFTVLIVRARVHLCVQGDQDILLATTTSSAPAASPLLSP
jgi:hypothetical protein